jgi:signal transduction histidine kinase
MRSLAKTRQLELTTGDLDPLVVHADEDRLKQVVTILVDNAIKYTPEGGTITVSVVKTPGIDYAKLSVQDSGPGISADDQEKIFERFYRVDKSGPALGKDGRQRPGLIAKMIIERRRLHQRAEQPGRKAALTCFTARRRKIRRYAFR